jgi:hypothetical protein
MLLSPYYFCNVKKKYYCQHFNEKNLELRDILIDSTKYFEQIRYLKKYNVCMNCVPTNDLF